VLPRNRSWLLEIKGAFLLLWRTKESPKQGPTEDSNREFKQIREGKSTGDVNEWMRFHLQRLTVKRGNINATEEIIIPPQT
jgi:hypothetical protein